MKRLFDETSKAFGKVDVLVNNAGVYKFIPIAEVTEEEYQRQFNTNVWGVLLTTREALKSFNDGGTIINVSSTVTRLALPGASVYAGTKGALDVITQSLAAELGPRKIRVNAAASSHSSATCWKAWSKASKLSSARVQPAAIE